MRLYQFAVDSLDQLMGDLDASGADDADLILVVPVDGSTVVADADEVLAAAAPSGGLCVAVSPVPLATPAVAHQIELVVADAMGTPISRCHPYPYGMVGPAGIVRALLADLVEWGSDADRLTTAVILGSHDVVLDVGSQFFHLLDGTGTDVVVVDGRPHAGDERPVVLIDLDPVEASRRAEGIGLYTFKVDSLAELSAELAAADSKDTDIVLALPAHAAIVAEPEEIMEAARVLGGICLAASPEALTSPEITQQLEWVVTEATGTQVERCHPYPCALVGPTETVRSLLADLIGRGTDADQLAAALLSGRHDLILDIGSQFFHILDATGTDVVMAEGRAHVGGERPLVLIDSTPDGRAFALMSPDPRERPGREGRAQDRLGPVGAVGLFTLAVDTLAELSAELDRVEADDRDVILVVPVHGAMVVAEPNEIVEVATQSGGICVAVSPVALASPGVAQQIELAIAEAMGGTAERCHPHPYGLVGPAGLLRLLLDDLVERGSDADRLTLAILSGRHDVILDISSQVFHVMEGPETDIAMVAGRAHVGDEQPIVLIDLNPDGRALPRGEPDHIDGSARDLARLFRYDGAVVQGDEVAVGPDVLVIPLWTPEFCATVVRAAEVAALWVKVTDGPAATVATRLQDLIPRLLALLESDIDRRVRPLFQTRWPQMAHADLRGARILRYQAGGTVEDSAAESGSLQLAGSVRLNDGYEGGDLVIPPQGWYDSCGPVGTLTVWQPPVTYPPEITPVTRGVKYRLALSWELSDV